MSSDDPKLTALKRSAEIVSAFVSRNQVPLTDLPRFIAEIHGALTQPEDNPAPVAPRLTPAQIRKSIKPEGLVSFEDGKPYKVLRKHLTGLGLTAEAYRAKWGLPENYPMTAPAVSAARAAYARAEGVDRRFGARRGGRKAPAIEPLAEVLDAQSPAADGDGSLPRGAGRAAP